MVSMGVPHRLMCLNTCFQDGDTVRILWGYRICDLVCRLKAMGAKVELLVGPASILSPIFPDCVM